MCGEHRRALDGVPVSEALLSLALLALFLLWATGEMMAGGK